MKKDIHPQYFSQATTECACGNTLTVGATQEKIDTEICSTCHPFYTGAKQSALRGGRIEKFQSRIQKKETLDAQKTTKRSTKAKKSKSEAS